MITLYIMFRLKMLRFGVFDDNDKLLGQVITFSPVFFCKNPILAVQEKNDLTPLPNFGQRAVFDMRPSL